MLENVGRNERWLVAPQKDFRGALSRVPRGFFSLRRSVIFFGGGVELNLGLHNHCSQPKRTQAALGGVLPRKGGGGGGDLGLYRAFLVVERKKKRGKAPQKVSCLIWVS